MTTADNARHAPLTDAELARYQWLTAAIDDVERRRTMIAQLRHGRRGNIELLALLDDRELELYAGGAALMRIRAPLHLRFKWPTTCRGR